MKLKRHGILAGIALTATLALAACGSDNTDAAGRQRPPPPRPANCAHRHADGAGLDRAEERHGRVDQGLPAASAPAPRSTTRAPAPARASRRSSPAPPTSPAPTRRSRPASEQPKADARCTAARRINLPMVIGPIAVVYNLDGVDGPPAHAGDPRQDLRRQDHQVGRRRRSRPTTRAPTLPSTAIQAVHRSDELGHHRQLHQVPGQDRRRPTGPSATPRPGRPRAARRAKGSDGVAPAGQEHGRRDRLRRAARSPQNSSLANGQDQQRRRRVRRADRRQRPARPSRAPRSPAPATT